MHLDAAEDAETAVSTVELPCCCLLAFLGRKRHDRMTAFFLNFLEVLTYGVKVEIEFRRMLVPDLTHLIYQRIFHHSSPISSSSVQMTGHSYPYSSTIFTIPCFICALLIWLKFQVKR